MTRPRPGQAHAFEPMKDFKRRTMKPRTTVSHPWLVCRRCGLVALKNQESRAAVRKPCGAVDVEDDPG